MDKESATPRARRAKHPTPSELVQKKGIGSSAGIRRAQKLVQKIAELDSEERAYMGPHAPKRYGVSDVLHSPKFRAGAIPIGESIGSGARRVGGSRGGPSS